MTYTTEETAAAVDAAVADYAHAATRVGADRRPADLDILLYRLGCLKAAAKTLRQDSKSP